MAAGGSSASARQCSCDDLVRDGYRPIVLHRVQLGAGGGILAVLPGGFRERGEASLGARHDRVQQRRGDQRTQPIGADERHGLLEALDGFVPAHAVERAVRKLQQATEQRAVFTDDLRHRAQGRVAVDGADESRQHRRPPRQILRLQIQVAEHADGGLECGQFLRRGVFLEVREIRVERMRGEATHGDRGMRAGRRDRLDSVRRVEHHPASLPIVVQPRRHAGARAAKPLIHKRAHS